MILDVFSITESFIGIISFILMAWAGLHSLTLALRWKGASTVEERSEVEKRSHLVLLVAVVVLGIRLLNCLCSMRRCRVLFRILMGPCASLV